MKAKSISFMGGVILVTLSSDYTFSVPISNFKRLRNASTVQLLDYRFIGDGIGIHWNQLDEDLSIEGLFKLNKSDN